MSKKKKPLWVKITLGIVALLVLVLVGGYMTFLNYFNKVETVSIDQSDLNIDHEVVAQYETAKEVKNIALFGVDSEDGVGRSDSIMIATIDTVHNKLKLTSIMRDSYVNIPGRGLDKINHAYAFGGPQLAIKTINENFGLNIDSFMATNFSSFGEIVDKIGGIEISITAEEVPHVAGSFVGVNKLNGSQALSYARIRYAEGGDYKRTERQRTVIEAVFSKFSTMPASSYPDMLKTLLPYVQTNLSATDILAIGSSALPLLSTGLVQERFPRDGYCDGATINGVYYLTFNLDDTKKQVMEYIFNDK